MKKGHRHELTVLRINASGSGARARPERTEQTKAESRKALEEAAAKQAADDAGSPRS